MGTETMNKKQAAKRIERLIYEYGETNLNSQEEVSKEFRKEINRKYYDKQNTFVIDGVLNELDPHIRKIVKDEVQEICHSVKLKELCWNCKIEVIIAIIILYVWRSRYKKLRVEQTGLWRKYDLTWRKYALIMENLLRKTREKGYLK